MRQLAGVLIVSMTCAAASAQGPVPRSLSFEDRVSAQEAIERVYYKHQTGATKPFEVAVPRAVLEGKVQKYLSRTAALESVWKIEVNDEALTRELARINRESRMPERLSELFEALGNDAFVIKECLARATLVDRLTRDFESPRESNAKAPRAIPPGVPRVERDASVSTCTIDGWDNGQLDDGPEPISETLSVWTGTEMLIWGTLDRQGWRYDPAIDHWSPMSESGAPSPRSRATAVWSGASMIVWGGGTESLDEVFDTGGRYDPLTDSWSTVATVGAPEARKAHTAIWTGSRMIVWGGRNLSSSLGTGALYDPATDMWTPIPMAGAPSPRGYHAAVWTGARMLVFGGADDASTLTSGGRYDPVSDTWAPTSNLGAPAVSYPAAVWAGGRMVVWDGLVGGRYDPSSDTWLSVSTSNAPLHRLGATAISTGSTMIVWGGSDSNNPLLYFDTGARYDPVGDQWTILSSAGAPSGRSGHAAIWTGQLMIVWGGSSYSQTTGFSFFLSGGRYDPLTDSWTPTAIGGSGTPSPRSNHVAVWTGTHMLIWGGEDGQYYGTGPLGTGGRYDPALDSWTPITTVNAPSPRTGHTAIWTGDSMIVWGGGYFDASIGGDTSLATGGRYNPLTDTWAPTTTVGAPTAREEHTAVWTGSRMVVWGGSNGSYDPLDTGGRYDPVTDTWAPTSALGAPFFRQRHSAVWTGSAMVIWGGLYGGIEGGRYDPTADTWLPTSTVGAPAERWWHEAIWTGSRMLVWGGEVDGAPPSGGASYDPVGNTWQPIPQTGQPATLAGGTAIWTGSEMVVWGGYGLAGALQPIGGRYDPATGLWRDTATTGAPAGRARHTAIWTGSRMLVWGGDTTRGAKIATGGSWFANGPATDECDGDGYTVAEGDCNDNDPGIFPGAAETCDGVDDDCNGTIDDGGDALCDDGNPCFEHDCQGVCVYTPVPEGTSCDDNNICNGHDECNGGGYCYSFDPPYCGLFNPCLNEWCDPLIGCMYEARPVGTPCPDGDACNGDETCDESGVCEPGTPMPAPPEVTGLTAASDKVTYSWSAAATAVSYNVVRGTTVNLPVGSGAGDEACLNTLAGASVTDSSVPPPDVAYWYLSRGVNGCAGPGTWGNRSDGTPRATTTCP